MIFNAIAPDKMGENLFCNVEKFFSGIVSSTSEKAEIWRIYDEEGYLEILEK